MAHLEPELLSAYIDHELPATDVAAIERHLAACDACRSEYEQLRALSALVRGLPVYLPKRDIDVSAYPRGGSDTLARIVAFSKPVAIAAAILLIAIAGLRLFAQMGDDTKDGNQIPFSAVQEAPGGTEPAGQASEEEGTEAPAAADRAMGGAPPMAAAPSQATQAPTVVATAVPEPAAGDSNGPSWLPEAVVGAVVMLLAGAAGWYKLAGSPGRPRA